MYSVGSYWERCLRLVSEGAVAQEYQADLDSLLVEVSQVTAA